MTLGEKFEKVADIVYDKGYEAFENHLMDCDSFQYFFADGQNNNMLDIWKEDYTKNAIDTKRMFSANKSITVAPRLNCGKSEDLGYMFYNASNLISIPYLYVHSYDAGYNRTFYGCSSLTEIRFAGLIQNDIDFTPCPQLSVESLKSIIRHLVNTKGLEEEHWLTVSFTDDCWERLEASGKPYDDELTADETLSWQDYVSDVLCWNT